MANRKRRIRRSKQNAKPISRIDRLRTGVPVTLRNGSKDPRQLPISFEWAVVVRYLCSFTTGAASSVLAATSPSEFPRINVAQGVTLRASVPLTFGRVVRDAWMRHYGYAMPTTADYNYSNSEFAIGKVSHFGPIGSFDHIVLQVQYAADVPVLAGSGNLPDTITPSFVGQDTGNRLSRAKISCTPPRLIWGRAPLLPAATSNIVVTPNWEMSGATTNTDAGVIDITVHIRRSYGIAPAATFTNVTYYESDKVKDYVK